MEKAFTSKGEVDSLLESHKTKYITSNFDFLNCHQGLRPGECHAFMAISGGGKSTLMRTILVDIVENKRPEEKVLLWLSEESIKEFRTQLIRSTYNPPELKMVDVESEQDLLKNSDGTLSPENLFSIFLRLVRSQEYRYVIFDNFTTSRFYMGKQPDQQDRVAAVIKSAMTNSGSTLIGYFHTRAGITEYYNKFITQNDVRGSKGPVMLFQYFYIMQQFIFDDTKLSTIRVSKHRTQDVETKIFRLYYSKQNAIYIKDKAMIYQQLKESLERAHK